MCRTTTCNKNNDNINKSKQDPERGGGGDVRGGDNVRGDNVKTRSSTVWSDISLSSYDGPDASPNRDLQKENIDFWRSMGVEQPSEAATPKSLETPWVGFFKPQEVINGRFAMAGFLGIVIVEQILKTFFGINNMLEAFGIATGNGINSAF